MRAPEEPGSRAWPFDPSNPFTGWRVSSRVCSLPFSTMVSGFGDYAFFVDLILAEERRSLVGRG